jgi:hypothetical protein
LIQVCVKYNLPKRKQICFLVRPLIIQWSLFYNFIHVYFIKFYNEKVGSNTILTNQFQTYLFTTFIILKFLKFCSWFTINPIEGSIISQWNLIKLSVYFLVFSWKNASFLIWFFFSIFYHAFTQESNSLTTWFIFVQGGLRSLTAWFIFM